MDASVTTQDLMEGKLINLQEYYVHKRLIGKPI